MGDVLTDHWTSVRHTDGRRHAHEYCHRRVRWEGEREPASVHDKRGTARHPVGNALLAGADAERGWHAAHGPHWIRGALRSVRRSVFRDSVAAERGAHERHDRGPHARDVVFRGQGRECGGRAEQLLERGLEDDPVATDSLYFLNDAVSSGRRCPG